jgi:hypothetical protein
MINNSIAENSKISDTFIEYASGILGDTYIGLTGNQIATLFSGFFVRYDVENPAFDKNFPKKRNVQ